MSSAVQVAIHPSQFPGQVRSDLLDSLRSRRVNHKFHYDSVKQTQKWLALHEAYSPARTDADCLATYDAASAATAKTIGAQRMHLIALGCGGGQKDARLLQLLSGAGQQISCTLSDVSVPMVLVARETVRTVLPKVDCELFVCDLATADDLPEILEKTSPPDAVRLVTFFGLLPNFEPDLILPRLATLLRPGDYLLASANLAPGDDYDAGVKLILPLYDNDLTREWLLTFLLDLGVERSDGELSFGIEDMPSGLKRIRADFKFIRTCRVRIEQEEFEFHARDSIRLFYSYRHTPELVRGIFSGCGLKPLKQWITSSGEEGVFLFQPAQ
jgi:L-histidine Nalpha-methyltransferase